MIWYCTHSSMVMSESLLCAHNKITKPKKIINKYGSRWRQLQKISPPFYCVRLWFHNISCLILSFHFVFVCFLFCLLLFLEFLFFTRRFTHFPFKCIRFMYKNERIEKRFRNDTLRFVSSFFSSNFRFHRNTKYDKSLKYPCNWMPNTFFSLRHIFNFELCFNFTLTFYENFAQFEYSIAFTSWHWIEKKT